MTRVAIQPVTTSSGQSVFTAIAGGRESRGATAGAALDALISQLPAEEVGMIVVRQNYRPDRFFGAAQQQRLELLMSRWRAARDRGESLAADEQAELDRLVEEEVSASAQRASALADELGL